MWSLSSLGTRATVWLRYLGDTHYAGLAGGVDPVGFAAEVWRTLREL
jgi:hypothetical protein